MWPPQGASSVTGCFPGQGWFPKSLMVSQSLILTWSRRPRRCRCGCRVIRVALGVFSPFAAPHVTSGRHQLILRSKSHRGVRAGRGFCSKRNGWDKRGAGSQNTSGGGVLFGIALAFLPGKQLHSFLVRKLKICCSHSLLRVLCPV